MPKAIDVLVNFPDGRCEKIAALSTDTVSELKGKIQSEDGPPPLKQKLVVSMLGTTSVTQLRDYTLHVICMDINALHQICYA